MTLRFKTLAATAAIIFTSTLPAAADRVAEEYVRKNANQALMTLNNPELNADQRTREFQGLMDQFADMDRIADFAIGKYVRQFSEADLKTYRAAYRRYALAVYENELDQYRGREVVVTGSIDRSDRDSIVETTIKRDGNDLPVKWRVMKVENKANQPDMFQVVDVALELDGNLLWLALEQRAQFLSLLDRSNGRASALIEKIDSMTEKLEREALADQSRTPGSGSGSSSETNNAG